MEKKNQRILWLLNHFTLREAEVPMLLNLGFEVFVPKIFPEDDANRSASVSYEYDRTLTIPQALLTRMNEFNFYSSRWPNSLKKAINENFSIVISGFFPKMLNAVAESFKGDIFIRVFGMSGDANYADLIEQVGNHDLINRLRTKDRIWLAPSYANIPENEPHWMRRRCVYLPLGLPLEYYKNEDQWRRQKKAILFVCPRIKSSPYYQQIYKSFKSSFGDIPHIIAGAQPEPVENDPHVTGFIPDETFQKLLKTCAVMFYHSREERHLHYHPLEAIVCGMPLIYMAGGMLDYLAGEKLPGCCETIEEARQKISRLISGDEEITRSIVSSQKVLLEEFKNQYIQSVWENNFLPLIKHSQSLTEAEIEFAGDQGRKVKIGIWMHETAPNGFLNEGISRLLALIVRTAQSRSDVDIKIACVSWVKDAIKDYMEDLDVNSQRLEFLMVNPNPPLVYQFHNWWQQRQRKPKTKKFAWLSKFGRVLKKITEWVITFSLKKATSARDWTTLLILSVMAILLSPFLLVYLILRLVIGGLRSVLSLFKSSRVSSALQGRLAKDRRISSLIKERWNYYRAYLRHDLPRKIYQSMIQTEFETLSRKASQQKDVDIWFFLHPNNTYHHEKFKTPIILAVPDIVYLDFPTTFAREITDIVEAHSTIEKMVDKADAVITYSEYVKENHLVKPDYMAPEKVHVIPHAAIDLKYLLSPKQEMNVESMKYRARWIIKNYLKKVPVQPGNPDRRYLQSLPFGEFDYIFVSSQTRPHKNHFSMIKAYEILLREKYCNAKLIFTGLFTPEMQNYIALKKLNLDVISLNALPPKVHAGFYACARLAVAPTLFEGGFPFVFSEALSVQTPVVMSDIPAVREILSDEQREEICFDPYDLDSMVDRIAWALEHHDQLLDLETAIFEKLKQRTWDQVASEYLCVFMETIRGSTQVIAPEYQLHDGASSN